MGFGHRIYRTRDPRADVLGAAAEHLFERAGNRHVYDLARAVETCALRLLHERHPELQVEGEMHGDSALDAKHRLQIFPNARMREDANLLIFPTLDAANIAFNLLKNAAGEGVTIGPMLLGAAKPVHVLTPSATVRRIINMTALTVVEAGQRE